jgi:membrane protein
MTFMGHDVSTLLKATGREIMEDRVTTLAAQTAYYFFFSLFPLLLFLAPLLTMLVEQETFMRMVTSQLTAVVPEAAVQPIALVMRDVVFVDDAPGLISMGILLAAWSGSNIFGALTTSLNIAYDVDEWRPWWKRQLVRLGMLVVGGTVIITATVVILAGDDIARTVGTSVGLGVETVRLWTFAQYPVAFGFVVLFAFLTYWLLPNVQQDKRHILTGAVSASTLWLVATLIFRLYVQRFPPNPAYGIIGGIMILLTWMYLSMLIVLIGGELASELHHGTGAVAPRKGATYFGRVVSGETPGKVSPLA